MKNKRGKLLHTITQKETFWDSVQQGEIVRKGAVEKRGSQLVGALQAQARTWGLYAQGHRKWKISSWES